MWLQLLCHLQKWLQTDDVARKVLLGARHPAGTEPTGEGVILLMRGSEELGAGDIADEVRVTIYLEAWIRDDNPDLGEGYKKIACLEERIDASLQKLREQAGRLEDTACMVDGKWQLLDFNVTNRSGDNDSLRPLVGTQYTITARLYNTAEEGGIW